MANLLKELVNTKVFKYKDFTFRYVTIGDELNFIYPFKEQLKEGLIDGYKHIEGSAKFNIKVCFYSLYVCWTNNIDEISFEAFEKLLYTFPNSELANIFTVNSLIIKESVSSDIKALKEDSDNEGVKKKKKKRRSQLLIAIFCLVGLALFLRLTTS